MSQQHQDTIVMELIVWDFSAKHNLVQPRLRGRRQAKPCAWTSPIENFEPRESWETKASHLTAPPMVVLDIYLCDIDSLYRPAKTIRIPI